MKSLFKLSVFVCLIPLTNKVTAQQNYTAVGEYGTVVVSGTSNLHDWEMQVEDFRCNLEVSTQNPSFKIQAVSFSGTSGSIKSHSSIMDRKTYDAMQADQYPEIRFENLTPEDIPLNSKSFKGAISGDLFLAGKNSTISVPFSGEIISDEEIRITGSKRLNMSDYDIDPPTALLGTLKTGDEVTVSFNLVFRRENTSLSSIK